MAKNNYYVKNKDLIWEIQEMRRTGKMSNTLGGYILRIVDGIGYRPNFCGYTYLDEMKSEAIIAVIKGIGNFDCERGNAFAYITQIAWNAFVACINKEKRKSKTKNTLFDVRMLIEDEYGENNTTAIDYSQYAKIEISETEESTEDLDEYIKECEYEETE